MKRWKTAGACLITAMSLAAALSIGDNPYDGKAARAADEKPSQTWGELSGRFIYGGDPPRPAKLELNKDVEVCSQYEPRAEQLLVNPENRGIANVVLWLEMPSRREVPPIHESYAASAESEVVIANEKCRFAPHITTMRPTQKLVLKNSDSIAHNTAASLRRNPPFNAVTAPGGEDTRSVRRAERAPAKISCSIHAWMTGWLLVQDHPYMAVTDADGRFAIKNLPAGEWTFRVWHELPEDVTAAKRGDESQQWAKGRVTVTVKEGANDFGEWTLSPELFEQ